MTVISTVITKYGVVHASDSYLTVPQSDGTYKVVEDRKPKIVKVEPWRGAMSYWGLAEIRQDRGRTLDWLQDRANEAHKFKTAEAFAINLTGKLNDAIAEHPLKDRGIGVHLTVYEKVNDKTWIPELFRTSNFKDTKYNVVLSRVRLTRETYNNTVSNTAPDKRHREVRYRMHVYRYLNDKGGILLYNNGDPLMFNPVARAVFELIEEIRNRGSLIAPDNIETYRAIARMPIEVVAEVQRSFVQEGKRLVGGLIHDLAVTEDRTYTSSDPHARRPFDRSSVMLPQ